MRPEIRPLRAGDLIVLEYAAWRVVEVNRVEDVDLDDDERRRVGLYKPEFQERHRPVYLVLRHENGPVLLPASTLDDGSKVAHIKLHRPRFDPPTVLADRYQTCSCHGHPWPCQDVDRDEHMRREAAELDRLLASVAPGVCAACREPITTRQKTLTFPEPSLRVPGAPGPTYHAGRHECWYGANQYETLYRLPATPDAVRLASCPGTAFIHRIGNDLDCDAGPACTGHHGPGSRNAYQGCSTRHAKAWSDDYPRPLRNCGYRNPEHADITCIGLAQTSMMDADESREIT